MRPTTLSGSLPGRVWLGLGATLRKPATLSATILTMLFLASPPALGLDADLNDWTAYNQPHSGSTMPMDGNWVVAADGSSAIQVVNGKPTFFASPNNVDGYRITATFTPPAADNDVFGIALGFSTAPSDPATDYLLIDWRKEDQTIDWLDGTGPVDGETGLRVSRVTGVPTLNELWGHIDSPGNPAGGVDELAQAANLGSTGWVEDTGYEFVIEYTTTQLDVWVNGSYEFLMFGNFPAGPMALYDFSQAGLEISDVTFESLNDPPEVVNGGAPDVNVDEGDTGITGGAFTDPNDDPLSLSCSGPCAGFSDDGGGMWSWSQLLPEGPDTFSVTVTASDGEFEVDDTFQVTVDNVAPVITATTSIPAQLGQDTSLSVTADFTDVGVLDTHTALFDWGDGTSSDAAISETAGAGTADSAHLYGEPGFYTITVTVWDDDGGSDTAILGEVFVFDPDTFVTGGGWVDSPQDALVADPGHSGKATFGFVVRYTKDGSVDGNLQLGVHKGLSLHATGFEFLLINDGIATFEGTARVNGEAGYSFRVVATDERFAAASDDLIWIEVIGPDGVVYDGATFPSQGLPIVGRGIQVHK